MPPESGIPPSPPGHGTVYTPLAPAIPAPAAASKFQVEGVLGLAHRCECKPTRPSAREVCFSRVDPTHVIPFHVLPPNDAAPPHSIPPPPAMVMRTAGHTQLWEMGVVWGTAADDKVKVRKTALDELIVLLTGVLKKGQGWVCLGGIFEGPPLAPRTQA